MKCSYCDKEHPDTARFCPNTGKPLNPVVYCMNCGSTVEAGQVFCGSCGAPVTSPPGSASTVRASPPPPQVFPITPESPPLPSQPPQNLVYPAEPYAIRPEPGTEPQPAVPVVVKKRHRGWRLFTCGCLGLPAVFILLLALFVVFDPLKLNVWGRLTGNYDAAAAVMPPDTGLYVGFNLLAATPGELEWVAQSFSANAGPNGSPLAFSATPSQPAGLAAVTQRPSQQVQLPTDLLRQIQDSTGLRIPNDLYPWVGQFGGIGLLSTEEEPNTWFVAVEARSNDSADQFLQTLRRNLTDIQEMSFSVETVGGVSITVQDVPADEQRVAFGRSGRMVLIAANLNAIRQMLSAQDGRSLAQDAVYQQLVDMRPLDWTASLYVGRDQVENTEVGSQLINGLGQALGTETLEAWNGSLVSAAIVPAGLRLDTFNSITPAGLPESSYQILESIQPGAAILQRVPGDAIFYTAGPRLDLAYASFFETELLGESARSDLMHIIRVASDFDPEEDLINRLDREWVVYLVPDTTGFFPTATDLSLAVTLLAGTSDMNALEGGITQITQIIEDSGVEIPQAEDGDVRRFEIPDPLDSGVGPSAIYGLGQNFFFFGTDPTILESALYGSSSLMDDERYQQLTASIPDGMATTLYVDLDPLIAILRDNMYERSQESFDATIAPFQAIQEIILAVSLPQDDILRSTFILGLPPR